MFATHLTVGFSIYAIVLLFILAFNRGAHRNQINHQLGDEA